jgi:hypothetical protein
MLKWNFECYEKMLKIDFKKSDFYNDRQQNFSLITTQPFFPLIMMPAIFRP